MCDSCLHWFPFECVSVQKLSKSKSNGFITNVMLVVCNHVILVCVIVCITRRTFIPCSLWQTQHDIDSKLATGYSPTCDQMGDSSIARYSYRDGRGRFEHTTMALCAQSVRYEVRVECEYTSSILHVYGIAGPIAPQIASGYRTNSHFDKKSTALL